MKPKPLASLNHFTVPVVRMFLPLDDVVLCSECGNAVLTDTTLFVFIKPVILRDDKFQDLRYLSDREVKRAEIPENYPQSRPIPIH